MITAPSTGYVTSDGRCLPCLGTSEACVPLHSCHGVNKLFPQFWLPSKNNLAYETKRVLFVCTATSRRSPDFSRQSRQGHGFSRKNRQSLDKTNRSDSIEETEFLSSKNGPLLSLSGSPRFQATSAPGPREREIVELFRKVQAQLRERAAVKEEKRFDHSQGQGERGTVDSLLKLLRKHSSERGKKSGRDSSEDFDIDNTEVNGLLHDDDEDEDDHRNQTIFDASSIVEDDVSEQRVASLSRPASNFRRKSPVPRAKYQSVYTTESETSDSSTDLSPSSKPRGKRKKNAIQTDVEPDSLETHEELDENSVLSASDDAGEEIEEPSPIESTDLSSLKLSELRVLAKSRGVKGYSKMKKGNLLELLSKNTC